VSAPVWMEGDAEVRAVVEAWGRGDREDAGVLAESPRRQLVRLARGDGSWLLLKVFRASARRTSAGLGSMLGRDPAQREWTHLRRLAARGVPVPRPLARGRRGDEQWLVLEFCEGRPLLSLRGDTLLERRRALAAVGRAVARLHRAGLVHGDLHVGNVLLGTEGPVLLDFQRARRPAWPGSRLRDLGALDFSLRHHGFSIGDRLCLRREALGTADRTAMRRVARASGRRARAYFASRTRRALREGRRFALLHHGGERGLRLREISADALCSALADHDRAAAPGSAGGVRVLKRDHRSLIVATRAGERSVVVKEVVKPGWARRLADVFRGSPARRAWRAGYGLECRGIGAARPLAFVERRRLGVPVRSRLVLEDLAPARPASDPLVWKPGPQRALRALDRLLRSLHQHSVCHGDLQGLHVYLEEADGELRARVIDLEGVRFVRRLGDARRRRALAELNASLPESFAGAADRRALFERYVRALPFREDPEVVLRRVVRQSLERGHRWSGADCRMAGRDGARSGGFEPSG